jgi:RimJ/RimL family protein N-acetyltransferase
MAKEHFKIIPVKKILENTASHFNNVSLDTISSSDLDNLRNWKNAHRKYFFLKSIITKKMQLQWFEEFKQRDDDYMFILNYEENKIGCIGYRLLDGLVDIYNVILGNKSFASKGLMSFAIKLLCSYILDNYKSDITVRVLLDNPARKWYEKNGF